MVDDPFWSLGYLLSHDYRITVSCANGHAAEVDIAAAISRLGSSTLVVEDRHRILAALRCRVCGRRGHDMAIQPPGIATPGAGHSMS